MLVALGALLHALGGFASGSFYLPYKKVAGWAWESYWLVGGVVSWLVAPWVLGCLPVPHLLTVLTQAEKQASISEFDLRKELAVAVFSGIMSACSSFGLTAGQPIAKLAAAHGTSPLFVNNAIRMVILAGGLTTDAVWCVYLNLKNKTYTDYPNPLFPALRNVLFCALAGTTWYFQFFFYGMGDSQMGAYRFSGWTLHMAFSIAFSSVWGLLLHEWRGANKLTLRTISLGISIGVLSTVVVGCGNYLAT